MIVRIAGAMGSTFSGWCHLGEESARIWDNRAVRNPAKRTGTLYGLKPTDSNRR